MDIYLNNLDYRYEIYELVRSLIGSENVNFVDDEKNKNNILSIHIDEDINIDYYKDGELVYSNSIKDFKLESTVFFKEKMVIKHYLLYFFEKFFSITSNWGVLTGIRPVKVVRKLFKDYDIDETKNILINQMKLSHEKADLVTDVAMVQNEYINDLKENSYSIYINIPFCPTRCDYCSFSTLRVDKHGDLVPEYLNTIIYELESLDRKSTRLNSSH